MRLAQIDEKTSGRQFDILEDFRDVRSAAES